MINLNEMKKDYIGREPRDYIVESVTVPEGLEEKVLAAMTQKRKEIEEIQKEKQEKKAAHKSVAIRAVVIAAVITLMILIIPSSRQVVVSAAENFWNFCSHFFDDQEYHMDTIVIHPEYKQTSDTIQKVGSVNYKMEVDGIIFDFQDLYYNKETEITDIMELSVNISRDDSTEYMPVLSQYLEIVAEKNSKIVFTGTMGG